jgi:hypothetical protein
MNYQQERDEFIGLMVAEGLPVSIARAVMSKAATIQRLSEAECNGDYPCDNGERKVKFCARCESGYVPSSLNKAGVCPNCRAQDQIAKTLTPFAGFKPNFQGDPRGACVKLSVPSGKTNDMGREGICVPTRSR